jgi:glycosyltransferase involved in cell wall biosynthesis
MDADLQDEPREIPQFVAKIGEGFDVVSGWKKCRQDPRSKTMPSRLFNFVVGRVSGLSLRDFNCGYKAYRREALANLRLHGELHRFVPVLLHWQGFRIAEIAVEHHRRISWRSKYGVSRFLKGGFDLLTVILTTRHRARPLHLFGTIGLIFGTVGTVTLGYLSVLWFLGDRPIGTRPLLFLGLLLLVVGIQLISTGLIAEFISSVTSTSPTDRYLVDEPVASPEVAQRRVRISTHESHARR